MRPELDRLFKKLCVSSGSTDGNLRFPAFAAFMRDEQKVCCFHCNPANPILTALDLQTTLNDADLQRLFVKYASLPKGINDQPASSPPGSPARNALELAMHSAAITAGLNPGPPEAFADLTTKQESTSHLPIGTSSSPPEPAPSPPQPIALTHETGVWTAKNFTTFLLSPCNAAFRDEKHDMTRPLPEYFCSSSHNTYLVGHQLVGESTIEGYIRALLHSCRSVERKFPLILSFSRIVLMNLSVDIYDGEIEPVIYHGKTLTTKVPLRDICQAIARYAFVASPYPVIISAEIHCGLPQQTLIAEIMSDVFGDALVKAPVDGRPKLEFLPSPEDLKGRVLVKTKNLYISQTGDGSHGSDLPVETESESTETSASDTDMREELRHEIKHEWKKAKENEAEMLKGVFYSCGGVFAH